MTELKVVPYKGRNRGVYCFLCGFENGNMVFKLDCDMSPSHLDMLQKSLRGGFIYPLVRRVTNMGACRMVCVKDNLEITFTPIEGNEGNSIRMLVKKEDAWGPIKHCLELSLKRYERVFG